MHSKKQVPAPDFEAGLFLGMLRPLCWRVFCKMLHAVLWTLDCLSKKIPRDRAPTRSKQTHSIFLDMLPSTSSAFSACTALARQKSSKIWTRLGYFCAAAALLFPTAYSVTTFDDPWKYSEYIVKRDSSARCLKMHYKGTVSRYVYNSDNLFKTTCTDKQEKPIWTGQYNEKNRKYTKSFSQTNTIATLRHKDNGALTEEHKNRRGKRVRKIKYSPSRKILKINVFQTKFFSYVYDNDSSYLKKHADPKNPIDISAEMHPSGLLKRIIFANGRTLAISSADGETTGVYSEKNGDIIKSCEFDPHGRVKKIKYSDKLSCEYQYKEDGYIIARYKEIFTTTSGITKTVFYGEGRNYRTTTPAYSIEYERLPDGLTIAKEYSVKKQQISSTTFSNTGEALERSYLRNNSKIVLDSGKKYSGDIKDMYDISIGTAEYDEKGRIVLEVYNSGFRSKFEYADDGCCTETYFNRFRPVEPVTYVYNTYGTLYTSRSPRMKSIYTYEYGGKAFARVWDSEGAIYMVAFYGKKGDCLKKNRKNKIITYAYIGDNIVERHLANNLELTEEHRYDINRRITNSAYFASAINNNLYPAPYIDMYSSAKVRSAKTSLPTHTATYNYSKNGSYSVTRNELYGTSITKTQYGRDHRMVSLQNITTGCNVSRKYDADGSYVEEVTNSHGDIISSKKVDVSPDYLLQSTVKISELEVPDGTE